MSCEAPNLSVGIGWRQIGLGQHGYDYSHQRTVTVNMLCRGKQRFAGLAKVNFTGIVDTLGGSNPPLRFAYSDGVSFDSKLDWEIYEVVGFNPLGKRYTPLTGTPTPIVAGGTTGWVRTAFATPGTFPAAAGATAITAFQTNELMLEVRITMRMRVAASAEFPAGAEVGSIPDNTTPPYPLAPRPISAFEFTLHHEPTISGL